MSLWGYGPKTVGRVSKGGCGQLSVGREIVPDIEKCVSIFFRSLYSEVGFKLLVHSPI